MKLERTFEVTASPSDARQRISASLSQAGYRLGSESVLKFNRGSIVGSLSSFSPRKWKADGQIVFRVLDENSVRLLLDLDVNTTGQIVTERETDYWNAEVDGIQAAIQSGEVEFSALEKSNRFLTASGRKGVVVFLGVWLAAAISIQLLISFFFESGFGNAGLVLGLPFGWRAARKPMGL